jgi:outer membrane protein
MRLAAHLSAAAAALTLVATSASAQAAGTRFAYIDSRAVLQSAPSAAAAQSQLERELGPYGQQVQRMRDSLQTMIADYSKVQATLTAAQRETREKAIRDKQTEYGQRTEKLQDDAQKREAAIMQPLMEQIRTVIEDVRKQGNYAMIFDVSAASGMIVAADKSLDLTQQVVTRVKALKPAAAAPAGAPAAAPAAGPRGAAASPAGVTRPKTPTQ